MIGKLVYQSSLNLSQSLENDDAIPIYSRRTENPLDKLNTYKTEKSILKNETNNYNIETLVITSNTLTEDTMVLVHGIQSNYDKLLKYAFEYLENGYNVVLYKQINANLSNESTYTFGRYEKYDLDNVVKHAKSIFPTGKLGVQGFSIGAATSAMHAKINNKHKLVDFYILDSPYSKLESSITLGIKAINIPLIPTKYITTCGDLYTQIKDGFSYDDIKPVDDVKGINTPMMLIHGTSDNIYNSKNSQEIYDNIPHKNKELWLVDDIEHISAFDNNQELYMKKVLAFINTYKDK
ncbi:MAG: alpha/beta hydrolase [Sarcina sp.]